MKGDIRFTKTRPPIKLIQGSDGFWRDEFGTIYGYPDPTLAVDHKIRCGVGPFSFPEDSPYNILCSPHDAEYENPVYQEFHPESESNKALYRRFINAGAPKILAKIVYAIVDQLGGWFWDNKKTRDK